MRQFTYANQERARVAARRILASFGERAIVQVTRHSYRVVSESGHGYYNVQKGPKGWGCDCKAFQTEPSKRCKHQWVRAFFARPEEYASAGQTASRSRPAKKRDWGVIGASRKAFEGELPSLLWDLLQQVQEPGRPTGQRGRPPTSLRAKLYQAIMYVARGTCSEQFYGELLGICREGHGILSRPGNYSTPSRIFNAEGTYQLLLNLIELSVQPLLGIEEKGTIIVDSTGFATTVRGSYLEAKAKERGWSSEKRTFCKGHLVIGYRSQAVLAVAVTNERGSDSPQFVPLVQAVVDAGFQPAIALADRAYNGRDNYRALANLSIDGYLPFKLGATGRSKGSPEYHRKFMEWSRDPAAFDEKYNLRSVIESVNHAIKTVIGEPLLSKNEEAQSCEVLAKILVYNLRRIVYWSARLGSRAEQDIPPEQPHDPVRLPLESLYSRPEGWPRNN
jgi:Transposase DDE domain